MSEPKIARRCPTCGASIRDVASFCPQCGEKLHAQPPESDTRKYSALTAPLISEPEPLINETEPLINETEPLIKAPEPQELKSPNVPAGPANKDIPEAKPAIEKTSKTPKVEASAAPVGGPAPVGKVRGGINRATNLARDVEGNVIHRVQQVREVSSVVLDEAGYDPSLRFVLVAIALFLVTVIIMLLNKFIT